MDDVGRRSEGRFRRVISATVGIAILLVSVLVASPARAGQTIMVDDDGQQCAEAAHATIGDALDDAVDGDAIRVCPGTYRETLHITKSVRVVGPIEALQTVDCLAAAPSQRNDLDTTRFAILEPPLPDGTESAEPVVSLDADGIEFAGMVVQGVIDTTPVVDGGFPLYVSALASSDAHSGYRVHHNLIRLNTLAMELGSSGESATRFAENCVRENRYGVANQGAYLGNAVIGANTVARIQVVGIETSTGYRSSSDVTVRDNRLDHSSWGIIAENATRVRIVGNHITGTVNRAIWLTSGNVDAEVIGNTVEGVSASAISPLGISFTVGALAGVALPRSADVVARGNSVTGIRVLNAAGAVVGVGIHVGADGLNGAVLADNESIGNGQAGLTILASTSNNVVRDNVSNDNAGYGIRIQGTASVGNRFIDNAMSGNGVADARDDTDVNLADGVQLLSEWRDNRCSTDIPVGSICGAD